ncbi:hypothetical protein Q7267_11325 [Glaesserella parasuis]|uniref:Ribbon-helix-helix protein, CopG family n=2 Tax=Glaesserella parasuis TaxID=738 RepID=A0A1T0AB12_GLAPU|nr:hypothetical protein [Glaesserella parasuis]AIK89316.1 hypothetical protein JT17_00350 [Glaesserella parasuis]KDB45401.1 hypothetical protein HPS9_07925 [Glaesserella parasuis HPS9]KDD79284.1 hypothetical protein HPS41_07270 [Glaesserella parasuis ST4-1]MCT8549975.1 hypothetical protein [Glaesserella parasuis]MCT8761916.1 hypothetical protein [Glaesserella parasuis]
MKLSINEIKARSDEKRGVKAKSYKLSVETIALIEQLARERNIPQNQLIKLAVEQLQNQPIEQQ